MADRLRLLQFEKLDRIEPPDLESVCFADARNVEPIRRVVDVLEWPVGGEKDAVGTNFKDRVDQ